MFLLPLILVKINMKIKICEKRRHSDCSLYLCLELHFNCKQKVWVYFDVYHWQDCAPMYILCTMYVHCTYAKSSKFWRKKLDSKYLFVSSKSSLYSNLFWFIITVVVHNRREHSSVCSLHYLWQWGTHTNTRDNYLNNQIDTYIE